MIEFKSAYVQHETWKIYPNVRCLSQVVLSDAEGKELYSFPNVAHGQVLDISNLPPGIYSIKVFNDNEEKYLKIVKQ